MTKTTIIPVGHVNVQLLTDGDAIARMMLNGKEWEPETRAAWDGLIQRCPVSDLVLDIGAYTGVYTIASALMGMKVMALEPHPANYARLLMNGALNSMRFDARAMAASDTNGTKRLHMKNRINDTASLEVGADALCVDHVEVQTRRIDDLPLGDGRVGLLKIDAEHHSAAILAGAPHTLVTHKPLVVVETLTEREDMEVFAMLCAAGYKQRAVLDGRNRLYAV